MAAFDIDTGEDDFRLVRVALCGPPGQGKSHLAVELARAIGGKFAGVDTEQVARVHGKVTSAWTKLAVAKGIPRIALEDPNGDRIMDAAEHLAEQGYTTVIIDSVSAEWAATETRIDAGGGVFRQGGRDAKIDHRAWVQRLVRFPGHLILTERTRNKWVQVEGKSGREEWQNQGLEARQDEDFGYEIDVEVLVLQDRGTVTVTIRKSRIPTLVIGTTLPTADFVSQVVAWASPSEGLERLALIQNLRHSLAATAKRTRADLSTPALRDAFRDRACGLACPLEQATLPMLRAAKDYLDGFDQREGG